MSESTLTTKLDEIEAEIGWFLGWGRGAKFGAPAWTAQQQLDITGARKSGERKFYFPPVLPGEKLAHCWSFLRPRGTVVFPANVAEVNLPDDFGGVEGEIVLVNTATNNRGAIRLPMRNPQTIAQAYAAQPNTVGPPQMAAIEPRRLPTATLSSRYLMRIFPLTDQVYTFEFNYVRNPDAMTAAEQYPLGGPMAAEAILEAALAVAESRLDDSLTTHTQLFMQALKTAVDYDRRLKPQHLGVNADRSDLGSQWPGNVAWWHWDSLVTINGVLPS